MEEPEDIVLGLVPGPIDKAHARAFREAARICAGLEYSRAATAKRGADHAEVKASAR